MRTRTVSDQRIKAKGFDCLRPYHGLSAGLPVLRFSTCRTIISAFKVFDMSDNFLLLLLVLVFLSLIFITVMLMGSGEDFLICVRFSEVLFVCE